MHGHILAVRAATVHVSVQWKGNFVCLSTLIDFIDFDNSTQ